MGKARTGCVSVANSFSLEHEAGIAIAVIPASLNVFSLESGLAYDRQAR